MEKPALTLTGLDAEELPALEETHAELQVVEEGFPLAEGSTEDSSNSRSPCQLSPRGGRASKRRWC